MSKLTHHDVEKIAHLARLALSEEQLDRYQKQLSAILDYAEMLNQLDLVDVEPTTHAVPMANVMRADVAEPALSAEQIFANTPHHASNQFVIQAILDEA